MVVTPLRPPLSAAFSTLLLGGGIFPPLSFGVVVPFSLSLWVVLLFFSEKQHHEKEGRNGNTSQRRRRKAAPLKHSDRREEEKANERQSCFASVQQLVVSFLCHFGASACQHVALHFPNSSQKKSLLQVTPYHGDKASFLGWKRSFLIVVRANSKTLHEGLKKIDDNMNQAFRKSRLSKEDLDITDQAYTLSALLCKDEACAYVRSAEDGNGCQAWQVLLRARTARNATNLLNQLLEPTFTSSDPRLNIRQWNKNAEEYATRTGERVSDGIRRAVYMNKIAQDMRQHLMLNQSRLSTAEEVCPGN